MTVIYLYDLDGWALHAVGVWLAESLGSGDVEVRVMSYRAWCADPVRCDVLYVSYSGLIEPHIDYRRWADRVVTTVHDPCELSFFEHRDDWERLPMGPLPLSQVDAVSAISPQLRDVLRRRYDLDPILTPTWSPRCASLRATARALANAADPIRVMSSTNVPARRPWKEVLRRLKHPTPFFRDERGRLSPRQLSALPARRRRKRVEWLLQIARELRDHADIDCEFTFGTGARRSETEYDRALGHCDVYACTSTMEGGPLPVLEAVMAGAAVLSTRVGQVPQWIVDGESGYFCSSPDEFVDRLRGYASDRALLRRHQERAREIAAALAPDLAGWHQLLGLAPDVRR